MRYSNVFRAVAACIGVFFAGPMFGQAPDENAPKQPSRPERPAAAAPALKPAVKPSQPPSDAAAKPPQSPALSKDTLVVVARLVEVPGKFPPNDLYNYVFIMKYRVIKVLKGSYAPQDILIGHYNPLIQRGRIKGPMALFVKGDVGGFEVNAVHTLVCVKPIESIWKDAIEDDYPDSDLEKYFALKADVVQ